MDNLLSINDLTKTDIQNILAQANAYQHTIEETKVKKIPDLKGKTVVNLFFENSTRTRTSFEIAGKWLGADVINISASTSSVKKGESLQDTIETVSALGADVLVVRHSASGAPQQIANWFAARNMSTKVINAGDGIHEHPTQALLDSFTILKNIASLAGKRIVIVGDILHSRVARSEVLLLQKMGAEITLVAPKTLLPVEVANWGVDITASLEEVLPVADILMLLRVQAERMQGGFFPDAREYSIRYGLNHKRAEKMKSTAFIMHPGPMVRGMEISYEVAEQKNMLALEQVNSGVYIRMAVLKNLLAK